MNITNFLQLPVFKDFKILAGESGLTNQITGVNILDNPKATDWLSPGELIVTSGYFFNESPDAIHHFLTSFNRLNIPAICIKPQIYLNPLPSQLIQLCDEFSIPLIEIPYGIAFSKILTTVMNLLSDSSNETMQVVHDMNSKFLEYGLQGQGVNFLKDKLVDSLGNPLIIANSDWSLLTTDTQGDFNSYLTEKEAIITFNLMSLMDLPRNIEKLKHPANIVFSDGQTGLILPIFFTEVTYGYMILLQSQKLISQKDYLVIEQAAITFALEIVHQTEKSRINNKILRDFYRKLIFSPQSIEEMHSYGIEFNYDIPYTIFVISIESLNKKSSNLLQQEHEEDTLFRNILNRGNSFQHSLSKDIHLFKQGEEVIGFLGMKETVTNTPEEQRAFFNSFYQYLEIYFKDTINMTFFVGSHQPLANLKQSYDEAKQMIEYGLSHQNRIYFAHEFYFDNFIHRFIKEGDANEFINHYLKTVIDYDKKTNSHLLETLSAYLNNQQNLATASRELFIHRNTLLYRIEKIESLLEHSLTLVDDSLSLSFAIKLYHTFLK